MSFDSDQYTSNLNNQETHREWAEKQRERARNSTSLSYATTSSGTGSGTIDESADMIGSLLLFVLFGLGLISLGPSFWLIKALGKTHVWKQIMKFWKYVANMIVICLLLAILGGFVLLFINAPEIGVLFICLAIFFLIPLSYIAVVSNTFIHSIPGFLVSAPLCALWGGLMGALLGLLATLFGKSVEIMQWVVVSSLIASIFGGIVGGLMLLGE